jgi:hypothetical protein
MLDRADQMMGEDVYDRLEVLTTAFEEVEAQL